MIYKAIFTILFLTLLEVHSYSNDGGIDGNQTTQVPGAKTIDLFTSSVRDSTLRRIKSDTTFTQKNGKQTQSQTSYENKQGMSDVNTSTTTQASLKFSTKIDSHSVTSEQFSRTTHSIRTHKPQSALFSKEHVLSKGTTLKRSKENIANRPTQRTKDYNGTTADYSTHGQNDSKTDEHSDYTARGATKQVSFRQSTTSLSDRTFTARTTTATRYLLTNDSTTASFPTPRNKTSPSASKSLPTKSTRSNKHKLRTTKGNKKDPTSFFTTLFTKSKHHTKNNVKSSTTMTSLEKNVSSPVYSKQTTDSISSQSKTVPHLPHTTSRLQMSSHIFHSKSQKPKSHTTSIQTMTILNLSTTHKKSKPKGKTKILINEIAISQNRPEEQFIELKVSSDYTHDLQSYEVVVFSGIGEVLSTMSIHGDTGKPYAILANEDIHVNIRKELQKKKSIAVAVYHRSESTSDVITLHSKGVMDAIVLTAYDGRPSDQLMQNLMKDNASPFHVSSSALTNGGTISRCAENHVRDTQDFMEMSEPKATRGFRNVKCPSNRLPTVSDNSIDNIQLTLIVVMSCLGLFFVIVLFVVMIMKQKQRQIKIMQNSINMKEDEDEEVVLKMASVKFDSNIEEPPTFDNNVYLAINS